MNIDDTTYIEASPATVWEVLKDPSLMPLWNSKIVACDILSDGEPRQGYRFKVHFKWREKEQLSDAEFIEFDTCNTLTIRYEKGMLAPKGYVDESFILEPDEGGTVLTQRVNIRHSGLPWWAKLLMKWISTGGYNVDKSMTEHIKELCES
jgi:uncharacterized protein YndB with AHSA1/START domain